MNFSVESINVLFFQFIVKITLIFLHGLYFWYFNCNFRYLYKTVNAKLHFLSYLFIYLSIYFISNVGDFNLEFILKLN